MFTLTLSSPSAVVTCRNEPAADRKSDEVLVHEPRRPRGGQ